MCAMNCGGSGQTILHQGWAMHQNPDAKTWTQYWLVLRPSVLLLFTSDNCSADNMVGTLTLGPKTSIHNLPSAKSSKYLLVTQSSTGETHENVFKFSLKNDRDFWRCFILAVCQGILPDVSELSADQVNLINSYISPALPSPTRHLAADEADKLNVSPGPQLSAAPQTVAASIARLSERRKQLASFAIEEATVVLRHESESGDSDVLSMNSSASVRASVKPSSTATGSCSSKGSGDLSSVHPAHGLTPTGSCSSKGSGDSISSHQNLAQMMARNNSNNNECHLFYKDHEKDDVPSWFVNCSREEAELILTSSQSHGNVLMRMSSAFHSSGKYVISLCREHAGKMQVSHYSVVKTSEGYKIDVRNEHEPLSCLTDVMKFFVSVAGHGTKPLTTHDLDKLIPVSLPPSPADVELAAQSVKQSDGNGNHSIYLLPSLSEPCLTAKPTARRGSAPVSSGQRIPPPTLTKRNKPCLPGGTGTRQCQSFDDGAPSLPVGCLPNGTENVSAKLLPFHGTVTQSQTHHEVNGSSVRGWNGTVQSVPSQPSSVSRQHVASLAEQLTTKLSERPQSLFACSDNLTRRFSHDMSNDHKVPPPVPQKLPSIKHISSDSAVSSPSSHKTPPPTPYKPSYIRRMSESLSFDEGINAGVSNRLSVMTISDETLQLPTSPSFYESIPQLNADGNSEVFEESPECFEQPGVNQQVPLLPDRLKKLNNNTLVASDICRVMNDVCAEMKASKAKFAMACEETTNSSCEPYSPSIHPSASSPALSPPPLPKLVKPLPCLPNR